MKDRVKRVGSGARRVVLRSSLPGRRQLRLAQSGTGLARGASPVCCSPRGFLRFLELPLPFEDRPEELFAARRWVLQALLELDARHKNRVGCFRRLTLYRLN